MRMRRRGARKRVGMGTYRVAIIGCGPRGMAQAAAYRAHPRTELCACCDLDADRRDQLGERFAIEARYHDFDRLLRAEAPDLVALPVGTEFHHPLAMLVLDHGCHLDVEKPLAQDLVQADAMIDRARVMESKIAVHHQTRVGAALRAVRETIGRGAIGELLELRASGKGYYGGYGLLNIGTHLVSNLVALAGHCRAVTATALTGHHVIEPEDVLPSPLGMGVLAGESVEAVLEFDHGVTAHLSHRRRPTVDSLGYGIEIRGSEGRLYWRPTGAWLLATPHWVPDGQHDEWQALEPFLPPLTIARDPDVPPDEVWYVDEFVRALDDDRAHPCSGVEGRHALEVIMGIFESAAWRRRVELPQPLRDHPLLRWRLAHRLLAPPPRPRDYASWLRAEDQRLAEWLNS